MLRCSGSTRRLTLSAKVKARKMVVLYFAVVHTASQHHCISQSSYTRSDDARVWGGPLSDYSNADAVVRRINNLGENTPHAPQIV